DRPTGSCDVRRRPEAGGGGPGSPGAPSTGVARVLPHRPPGRGRRPLVARRGGHVLADVARGRCGQTTDRPSPPAARRRPAVRGRGEVAVAASGGERVVRVQQGDGDVVRGLVELEVVEGAEALQTQVRGGRAQERLLEEELLDRRAGQGQGGDRGDGSTVVRRGDHTGSQGLVPVLDARSGGRRVSLMVEPWRSGPTGSRSRSPFCDRSVTSAPRGVPRMWGAPSRPPRRPGPTVRACGRALVPRTGTPRPSGTSGTRARGLVAWRTSAARPG